MRRLVLVLAWLACVLAALVLALRTWGLGAVQTWESVGAFGNAGLSACAFVGAVFLWHRFTVRGEVYALWGAFGNPATTDPSVLGKDSGGVANTNIVFHAGKLLALEEGKVKDGTVVCMLAAGIGYVWAANIIKWGPAL